MPITGKKAFSILLMSQNILTFIFIHAKKGALIEQLITDFQPMDSDKNSPPFPDF